MMQSSTMQYKGYIGSVEVDTKENILFGKLLHIRDLVNYEAQTPAELESAFKEAVDDYLNDCQQQGVEPDQPFKGQFNVRIEPSLHRSLAIEARRCGSSMNDYVESVLRRHKSISLPDVSAARVAHFFFNDQGSGIADIQPPVALKWEVRGIPNQMQIATQVRKKEYAEH